MFDIGPIEALLLSVIWFAVVVVILYWIIRLGVRHGVMDAHRRAPEGPRETTS